MTSLKKFLELFKHAKLAPSMSRLNENAEKQGYALAHSTGETVYGDRPLRFRNLTLTEADVPALYDPATLRDGFKIRISQLRGGRLQAGTLVETRYEDRGYQPPGWRKERSLHTFIAYDEGNLVGTVGVRLDSKKGLAADDLYPDEVNALRAQRFRLCEFTRLAVNRTVASKPVLAGMFHTAYLYAALMRGSTHAVIEVNPRHVPFYRRALNFELLGDERMCQRVDAPAVLLWVAFSTVAEGIAQYGGRGTEARGETKTFYPYFFAPNEEAGVLKRLRGLSS
ncbi:MAG TPA: hypothetical protein VNE58_09020 [Casimicrobiaceae bacterium]|nr:hypothetical protein [Casimicrobiaceae bacterium]